MSSDMWKCRLLYALGFLIASYESSSVLAVDGFGTQASLYHQATSSTNLFLAKSRVHRSPPIEVGEREAHTGSALSKNLARLEPNAQNDYRHQTQAEQQDASVAQTAESTEPSRHNKVKLQQPSRTEEFAGLVFFSILLLTFVGWGCCIYGSLQIRFNEAHDNISDLSWEFGPYVKYAFGNWLVWKENASLMLLGITSMVVLLVGTFTYFRAVPGTSIWHSSFLVFCWMLAPDGGAQERTWAGATCGAILSMCGLLIFALLLTLLNDLFYKYMEKLRSGQEKVMEVGHIVIIGLTKSTIHLIHELCAANAADGGVAIVIMLGGITKEDMQSMIADAGVDLKKSRLILRHGYAQYEADLDRAGVNASRRVIIIGDHRKDKEVRDAFVLQALLVLRSKGWPKDGHILLECSLLKNRACLQKIGGPRTHIVMTDRWLSKLFCQVSHQPALGDIVKSTFSFNGPTMFIEPIPEHFIGHHFSELAWHYPRAIPLGTITGDKPMLAHAEERTLSKGEDLIILAHGESDARAWQKEKICETLAMEARVTAVSPRNYGDKAENILLVGWGHLIGPFLVQLDSELHAGSRVIIVSPQPVPERESHIARVQRRWQYEFKKCTFDHVQGMLGSPTVFDRLPVDLAEISRIFILGDEAASDMRHADACTIAAVVQLRHIMALKGIKANIPIIPEIKDPRTEQLCKICNISSFVDSSGMPVQVLATVSVNPRLKLALEDLVGDEAEVGYAIRKLQDYLPPWKDPPPTISFMQAQGLVSQKGDVLLGWSWPYEDDQDTEFSEGMADYVGNHVPLTWDLNPRSKTTERPWSKSDSIVVLGYH